MSGLYEKFDYCGNDSAEDIIRWALNKYHPRIALACSLELPVLAHMIKMINPHARIFSIDTGRLPEETYWCAYELERRFSIKIKWYFPQHEAVEKLESEKGLFSFRNSIEARHECCAIRKVEPLKRALKDLDAWITGLRKEQSITRKEITKIEKDMLHGGILKINPIADWSTEKVWDYIRKYNIPYNKLLDKGYTSVGCECCTRAIEPGEDIRAGRWWWEQTDHKECGLHVPNWSI